VTSQLESEEPRVPGRRRRQTEQKLDRRRLSRPVGAEEPEDLASLSRERHVVDGGDAVEALGQMLDFEDDRLRQLGSSPSPRESADSRRARGADALRVLE
jgi:hypothetical protein